MLSHDLTHGWTVRSSGGDVPAAVADRVLPATVPGTVHVDLLATGELPDPYLGENETAWQWFHRSAWTYEHELTEAAAEDGERVDLVFEGLDTVATVALDGTEVLRSRNMHRTYRVDVRELVGGPRRLTVRFDSALEHAEKVEAQLGRRPRAYGHPMNAVRKMACSFGWDWGPDLQTAGIWKPARVQRWRTARLAALRPLATLDGTTGVLAVHVDVERSGLETAGALRVEVGLPGRGVPVVSAELAPTEAGASVELRLPDAPVWWPVGYGEQPLVDVEVALFSGADLLDSRTLRTAFRSVSVDTSADEHGEGFTLVVNGRPVFVRGVNWIPEDHLLTRLQRSDYEAALDRALEANVNLLRIWGGGIFESDDFYALCDEKGLLVWQDFLLACAAYAEEEPLRSEILAETRDNVVRLCGHPSLVLWNGGNENIWGHEDWGWKDELAGATWGAGYYDELFPALLAELDPSRPYSPGSPSNPGIPASELHPNDPDHGTRHEWDVWNRADYTHHLDVVPRFCSEFGWQAPPTWSTLTRALAPDDLGKETPAFLLHQKADDGNGKLDRGLEPHFGVPADFADWNWATQLNQARATTLAVDHLRSWSPRTAGSIVWQLNDCWPVTSWAVVDGDGRLKPAWYALRRAYADRLVTLQPREHGLALVVVNDSPAEWTGTALVRRVDAGGAERTAEGVEVRVPARSTLVLPVASLAGAAEAEQEVVVADLDGRRAVWSATPDHTLAVDPAPLEAGAHAVEGGYEVHVRAHRLARDVSVLADRVAPDAVVDDMLVTLLPGESHTFRVRTTAAVDAAGFTAPAVLRTSVVATPVD
ncbi:glycoside hydrolase family 2 protein [Kineococcus sp. R8]|uniref:glycoside hydrolase family 2 protein n=1 Tax=Kineococcus siccus TaxID=2696567 RepID=UPI001413051D|nr:glycoside hydrolase family 2 protein [Kineococcus siccus]